MSSGNATSSLSLGTRAALWFTCCLLLAAGFCFLLGKAGSLDVALRIVLLFVLPMWLLYLPVILKLKDAENHRLWIILASGALLGPAVLALWFGISIAQGESPRAVWQGDPLAPGTPILLLGSAILTSATVAFYGASLKLLRLRAAAALNKTA